MPAPCTLKKLPEFVYNLLWLTQRGEHTYISLRDFLVAFFTHMESQTEDRLDFDFKMYLANLSSQPSESHNISLNNVVYVQNCFIEPTLSDLFDRAHYAGLIQFYGDDESKINDVYHWSYIDPLRIMKGLCWVPEARNLLLSIYFEFSKVDTKFRSLCSAFKKLNNADVLFENASTFMHFLTDSNWVQLAAYCKARGIHSETTRVFLKNNYRTNHGLLSIESELGTNTRSNPQAQHAFIEVFSLMDDEAQPYLTP